MSRWRAKALELFPDLRSEIQSSESGGSLWIELVVRFQRHYEPPNDGESKESPEFIRAICPYAIWCTRSKSFTIQEPAYIGFYEGLARFALSCKPQIYKKIIGDLIANVGLAELEKQSGNIGAYMKPDKVEKFFEDARQAENERGRRLRKR